MKNYGCTQCKVLSGMIRDQLEECKTAFRESEEAEKAARFDGDPQRAIEEQARQRRLSTSIARCVMRLSELEDCCGLQD